MSTSHHDRRDPHDFPFVECAGCGKPFDPPRAIGKCLECDPRQTPKG